MTNDDDNDEKNDDDDDELIFMGYDGIYDGNYKDDNNYNNVDNDDNNDISNESMTTKDLNDHLKTIHSQLEVLSSSLWALYEELYRMKINFLLCQNVIVTFYAKPKQGNPMHLI